MKYQYFNKSDLCMLTSLELQDFSELNVIQKIENALVYPHYLNGNIVINNQYYLPPLIKECISKEMEFEYEKTFVDQILKPLNLEKYNFKWEYNSSNELLELEGKNVIFNVDPIEQHGPHLTIGTDINISHGFINYFTEILNLRKIQGVNLGCMRWALAIGSSLSVTEDFLLNYITNYIDLLRLNGVAKIYMFSTHLAPNHHKVLSKVCESYNDGEVTTIYPLKHLSLTEKDCHAGVVETALSMYFGNRVKIDLFTKDLFNNALSTSYINSISNLSFDQFTKIVQEKSWNGIVGDYDLYPYKQEDIELKMVELGKLYFDEITKSILEYYDV